MSCLEEPGVFVEVSPVVLDLNKYLAMVADPKAGAISTFIGVTRNNFQGKDVLTLEYEAYVPMALQVLLDICKQLQNKWDVTKVAVAHRTGVVAVGESSVIIVVSSPHRRATLDAVSWAIDELKAVVPIWKKEVYTDGSTWKENQENRLLSKPA